MNILCHAAVHNFNFKFFSKSLISNKVSQSDNVHSHNRTASSANDVIDSKSLNGLDIEITTLNPVISEVRNFNSAWRENSTLGGNTSVLHVLKLQSHII